MKREELQVREESEIDFADYATIPISFRVASRLHLDTSSTAPLLTGSEVPIEHPYRKDYDAHPGSHPVSWPQRFDTSQWGVLSAWLGGKRVGGAVMVYGSKAIDMLEGRDDLAVLWDIRVIEELRGHGIGSELVAVGEAWARDRGCRELKVETQDINVAACLFYHRQGFVLRGINPSAYPDLPQETQLLFYKELL